MSDQQLMSLKDLLNDAQMPKVHEQIAEHQLKQDGKKAGGGKDAERGAGGKHGGRGAQSERDIVGKDSQRRGGGDKFESRASFGGKSGRGPRGG